MMHALHFLCYMLDTCIAYCIIMFLFSQLIPPYKPGLQSNISQPVYQILLKTVCVILRTSIYTLAISQGHTHHTDHTDVRDLY